VFDTGIFTCMCIKTSFFCPFDHSIYYCFEDIIFWGDTNLIFTASLRFVVKLTVLCHL